ncbi:MAG: hypothetical protein AAGU19_17175 [Prolixibacteraceae bacterium]
MKEEKNDKQAWQTPEVMDLDIRDTKSGPVFFTGEYSYAGPVS